MKATKITSAEIAPLKVASLPSRPTAPTAFGGRGYSASDMKAAFDRLPLYVADRLNLLIDDVTDGELLDSIPTGIFEGHTLSQLVEDIASGRMASYLSVTGTPLTEVIQSLKEYTRVSAAGDDELRLLIDDVITTISEMSDCIDESIKKADRVEEDSERRDSEISLLIEENRMASDSALSEIREMVRENSAMLDGVSTLLDELHLYAQEVGGGAGI